MKFTPTPLAGSYLLNVNPFDDERGSFSRYYCKDAFRQIGHEKEWLQMNHSVTKTRGTLRGMHFQIAPYSEIKMVKCISGAVYDVIIDLRISSGTFLNWYATELSAKNRQMLYIPEGFAHGFQCLTDDCQLLYHHSAYYTPNAEGGIRYDDPMIGIEWPLPAVVISPRDKEHPYLNKNFEGI
jgi:dTDP-4-dehydrorhamnose 3,5-epimerase